MKDLIVVGAPGAAGEICAELEAAGARVRSFEPGPPGRAELAELAEMLVAFERLVEERRPDAVVLADDSDAALAAALVALKLLIEVEAADGASRGPGANAALISELAATYTPAS